MQRRAHGVKLSAEATSLAFSRALKSSAPEPKSAVPNNGNDRLWWKRLLTFFTRSYFAWCGFQALRGGLSFLHRESGAWGYPEVRKFLGLCAMPRWTSRALNSGCPTPLSVLDGMAWGTPHGYQRGTWMGKAQGPAICNVWRCLGLPAEHASQRGRRFRDVEGPGKVRHSAKCRSTRPKRDLWVMVRAISR